jgi:hypothetical protein
MLNFTFRVYVDKLQFYYLLSVFILLHVQLCLAFFSVYNTVRVRVAFRPTVSRPVRLGVKPIPCIYKLRCYTIMDISITIISFVVTRIHCPFYHFNKVILIANERVKFF